MANNHLIGKQVMLIDIDASENSYALQQQLSELVWNDLLPKLSVLFDGLVSEDEVLRLDKVELDLGIINLNTSSKESVVQKIAQLLEIELQHYKFANISNAGKRFNFELPQGPSTREYMFRLWLYWLEKGVLPSYALKPDSGWMSKVLEVLATERQATSALTEILSKNTDALQRLVLQHTQGELKAVAECFTGLPQHDLLVLFKELRRLFKQMEQNHQTSDTAFRTLEIEGWRLVFQHIILNGQKENGIVLTKQIVTTLPINLIAKLTWIVNNEPENYPFIKQVLEEKSDKSTIKLEKETTQQKFRKIEKDGIDKKPIKSGKAKDPTEQDEMESPQFFKNAGLVLLHPFLSRLFEKLELVEDKKFKDFYCQSKAVLLLKFLAYGDALIPEYELVLPKFLCGMPVNLPIDYNIVLNTQEKQEANSLLEAVIANWGALGEISPDGLREGFLIRDGKLINKSGWRLMVEAKAIDLLLDRLPWSISMLKLPWMDELLKIEWR